MVRNLFFTLFFCLTAFSATHAQVLVKRVFPNLSFQNPVDFTHAGDGSDRVFVVEKRGLIFVFPNQESVTETTTFLDIRARVNSVFSESGLLGVAFHPNYAENGKFYINYNAGSLVTRISEFSVSTDPDVAESASERILLEFQQPAGNHNGGQVAFGPDSMLYISTGDGGGANDQYENGQDATTLLGCILRIDVDNKTGNLEYKIPDDNPFVGNTSGWREEIWAYGLRNPWRISFDRGTGDLWAADVGQSLWEEIDLIEKGGNYGWNIMEGAHCFQSSNCDKDGLVMPVFEYDHGQGLSITGGYVYRGSKVPALKGLYLYGDFVTKHIWGLRYENGQVLENKLIAEAAVSVSAFGEDEAGEVYLFDYFSGEIYGFEDLTSNVSDWHDQLNGDNLPARFDLQPAFPNPFNPSTVICYTMKVSADVRVTIFDALGRRVKTLVEDSQPAGAYSVKWDATDDVGQQVSGGVYYVRLSAQGFRQVQKVVLIK